jgi:hypothetical protein
MANNENILRRPWRMKPRVKMMNKLKLDLARSLSSSGSVSTSPTSTFSTLSSYTSLASLTLKTTADMSSALLIKQNYLKRYGIGSVIISIIKFLNNIILCVIMNSMC